MNKSILVPIDGSDHAFKALDLACQIANQNGDSLRLLHVVETREIPEGLKQWAKVEHVGNVPGSALEASIGETLLRNGNLRAKELGANTLPPTMEHGNPARVIVETAERLGSDMIVMGTRGFSDLKGLVVGSVAHKVTHAAACTVVTVK